MNFRIIAGGLLAATTVAANAQNAIAIDPGPATQGYTGSLGIDFNVNNAIQITQIAAFNSTGVDFATPKTIDIWDRNNTLTPAYEFTITPGDLSTLSGSMRYVTLATPITLNAGFQGTLSSYGFNGIDTNFNSNVDGFGENSRIHLNTYGGAVSWVQNNEGIALNRYGAAGSYPSNDNTNTLWQLPNASFRAQAVPEPCTMLALGGGALALLRRRKASK